MGAVTSREIPNSPIQSSDDNRVETNQNSSNELQRDQYNISDNNAPEEVPYQKEIIPADNQQYDYNNAGGYYDNNAQYYYDENGNVVYYNQPFEVTGQSQEAPGVTSGEVLEGCEASYYQEPLYGENQHEYGVVEGQYQDPAVDTLATEAYPTQDQEIPGQFTTEYQDYETNDDYNENYEDEEGEEENDYDQGYNVGYNEGYEAGYQEGYTQTYNWYQAEYEKLNAESKYHLTYDRLPKDTKKFWKQRYSLFKKFDQGVFMTSELWYSVTPEDVALFVAKFIKACNPDLKVIADICCGGGGNSIQFGRKFDKVIAIDVNDDNIYCTKKNCEIYGVGDKVECIQSDWTKMMGTEYYQYLKDEVDLVFCSPPWGGPAYKGKDFFDLDLLLPLPIKELLISFKEISPNIVLFLPRNSNLEKLSQVTREVFGEDAKCRILYTYCGGFIKGITAFWGAKFMPENYHTHPEYNMPAIVTNDAVQLADLNNNSQFQEAQQFKTGNNGSAGYQSRSNRQTTPKSKEKEKEKEDEDEVMELDY